MVESRRILSFHCIVGFRELKWTFKENQIKKSTQSSEIVNGNNCNGNNFTEQSNEKASIETETDLRCICGGVVVVGCRLTYTS